MLGVVILQVLNVVLLAYLLLLSLRIVLSWFRASLSGAAWTLLCRLTDPYLDLFRRIPLLRQGVFDFSPIVAVLAIVVVLDLVYELLFYGRVTVGFVLASVLGALWSGASFLLLLFCVVSALRLAGLALRTTRNPALWRALDMVVQPVVGWLSRLLAITNRLTYAQCLAITTGVFFAAWFLGGIGVRVLVRVLRALPI